MLAAVILAEVLAATGVLVALSVVESVDVCSLVAGSAVATVASATVPLSAVEVVELLDASRDCASGRCEEPALEAVDGVPVAVFLAVVVDLLVVSSAGDDVDVEVPVVALGPRAVWPVVFFAEPELDVAELPELDEELWSVSSALATATTGPASDNPSARAAIPALAPR
ncbi:hypothetical protein [Mycolicibacterium helvum]|uniref:hypothetical protein n=1 Tax=Mycolicibacterium helvum TaxID=1534349 RepID=UPI0013D8756B|nr:hypothetical protein [Mycolicibacterium helvum]